MAPQSILPFPSLSADGLLKGNYLLQIRTEGNLTVSCREVIIKALEGCNLHTLLQVMPTECQHLCHQQSQAAITLCSGLESMGRASGAEDGRASPPLGDGQRISEQDWGAKEIT